MLVLVLGLWGHFLRGQLVEKVLFNAIKHFKCTNSSNNFPHFIFRMANFVFDPFKVINTKLFTYIIVVKVYKYKDFAITLFFSK